MTVTQSLIASAAALVIALVCFIQVRRALREESERDRIVAEASRRTADVTDVAPDEHDVGPDALRLLENLDAHLDDYFAGLAHLFEELGPPPAWLITGAPDLAPRLDRLRDAVRDEQQKGQTP